MTCKTASSPANGLQTQEKRYTIDDIPALPEGERAELIDGRIYKMAPPSRMHQRITTDLCTSVNSYIRSKNGSCEVYAAPFAVYLNEDNKNYVEPDISVICSRSKLNDNGCVGAPDWIIEVVSPSSRSMDYYKKLFKYRTAGVREYWIVDYEKSCVLVYSFESDAMAEYSFSEDIPAAVFPGFTINFTSFSL